jgi:NAD(P)-dependent dehydrogenase (short-subunit alcohol dehydrogenase family)
MGAAVALAFAREGAKVVVNDCTEERCAAIAGELASFGATYMIVVADISKSGEVQAMIDRIRVSVGPIDILVNNAGILFSTPVEEISDDEWDAVMNVNLRGAFLCSRAVLPNMKARGYGKIVNISSSAGRSSSELGGAHYTASKAGLLGFSRHLAREAAPFGINVNAVCPGLIDTPMIRSKAYEERLKYFLSQIPMARLGTVAEEADLVLFLASEQASYITGATVDLNGGSLMM